MFFGTIFLLIMFLLLKYVLAWIAYVNKLDSRLGDSTWRWTYDYPVEGKRDISDLDDKDFVRKRRVRNRTVSFMYWNFFIGFVVSMSFITNLLKLILY